ncbi:hypothetical protein [Motilimonas pumila]|uniref:Uncharacterized protein n=1 Tax=Motilimonas pumila TaxID=2303987 RepID=A0A418YDH0_9GAMM|nr:hypothetical protein [Motilimonas pumila]RJG42588.1 hypothetical protein D1Z90_12015 [Motilimonas pumila]
MKSLLLGALLLPSLAQAAMKDIKPYIDPYQLKYDQAIEGKIKAACKGNKSMLCPMLHKQDARNGTGIFADTPPRGTQGYCEKHYRHLNDEQLKAEQKKLMSIPSRSRGRTKKLDLEEGEMTFNSLNYEANVCISSYLVGYEVGENLPVGSFVPVMEKQWR